MSILFNIAENVIEVDLEKDGKVLSKELILESAKKRFDVDLIDQEAIKILECCDKWMKNPSEHRNEYLKDVREPLDGLNGIAA